MWLETLPLYGRSGTIILRSRWWPGINLRKQWWFMGRWTVKTLDFGCARATTTSIMAKMQHVVKISQFYVSIISNHSPVVLIVFAPCDYSDEPVYTYSLARAFAVNAHYVGGGGGFLRGGGEGTLIFSHIRKLGLFLGGQNSEFQIFGLSENKYFLGVWRFCGYFWGVITKFSWFEGHSYAFYGLF